jgi:hypothetical protein
MLISIYGIGRCRRERRQSSPPGAANSKTVILISEDVAIVL